MCNTFPNIGFIGLGIMGLPMARHLCNAGYPVTVYNRTAAKMDGAQAFGARLAESAKGATEWKDVFITMLTTPDAIRTLMDGPKGFLANPKKGAVWIQMSTIDIESTQAFGQAAGEKGLTFIDCPVSGSKKQVEAGQLVLLAGSDSAPLDYVRPLLTCFGPKIIHAGPVGAGTALKLCLNLIVAQMTTALVEAVALAEATAVDPRHVFETLEAAPALNCGYFKIKQHALLQHDYSPAFSLANMLKDVRFIIKEAEQRGTKLPVTEAVRSLMEAAAAEGHGAEDLTVIQRTLNATAAS